MSIRVLAALALAISCLSCSRTENIRVAHVPQDWFNAPVILAINGWPGTDAATGINTFSLTSGLDSKTAVAAGNAEVGIASPVVLLRDPSSTRSIRVLGCYMRNGAVLGIATRGSDIEAPIGYVANTISEVFLANFLLARGQEEAYFQGRIRKVPLLPPNMVQALQGDPEAGTAVRSVSIWEPHLSRAHREAGATIIPNPGVYTVNVCLIARRQATPEQRRAIESFAARVAAASAYIRREPDSARQAVESRIGLPSGSLTRAWRPDSFGFVNDRPSLERVFNEEIQALRRARMLNRNPDVAAYF